MSTSAVPFELVDKATFICRYKDCYGSQDPYLMEKLQDAKVEGGSQGVTYERSHEVSITTERRTHTAV